MADPLPDEALDEIRRRNTANLSVEYGIKAHRHLQRGCRCISCDVVTGYVIDTRLGPSCDEQPNASECSDGGCLSPVLTSVDAQNLVKGVEDVRVLLDEINRLKAALATKERSATILRKLLSLAHP